MYFETKEQRKESDAGEDAEAATPSREAQSPEEILRRELRDGPLPGPTAMKGAGVELGNQYDEALAKHYGGDPEREVPVPDHIVLSEN